MAEHATLRAALPAGTLAAALALRGWTQADAARRTRLSQPHISMLLSGRRGLTAHVAVRLEAAGLGTAEGWLGLQHDFDLSNARRELAGELAQIRREASRA